MRAFFMRHMKFCFCSQAGWSGSKPVALCQGEGVSCVMQPPCSTGQVQCLGGQPFTG